MAQRVILSTPLSIIGLNSVLFRGVYRLNNTLGDLSFLVATNMPEELKINLFSKLEMIYPNALKFVDTALEGQQNSFPAAHYAFWFKYGRRVSLFFFSRDV